MKRSSPNGFVIILALLLISLVGISLVTLNLGAQILAAQTNQAYLAACDRNLAASGFAWAQYAAFHKKTKLPPTATELNIDSMQIPQSSLTIWARDPNEAGMGLEIKTTCGRGATLRQRSRRYILKF